MGCSDFEQKTLTLQSPLDAVSAWILSVTMSLGNPAIGLVFEVHAITIPWGALVRGWIARLISSLVSAFWRSAEALIVEVACWSSWISLYVQVPKRGKKSAPFSPTAFREARIGFGWRKREDRFVKKKRLNLMRLALFSTRTLHLWFGDLGETRFWQGDLWVAGFKFRQVWYGVGNSYSHVVPKPLQRCLLWPCIARFFIFSGQNLDSGWGTSRKVCWCLASMDELQPAGAPIQASQRLKDLFIPKRGQL